MSFLEPTWHPPYRGRRRLLAAAVALGMVAAGATALGAGPAGAAPPSRRPAEPIPFTAATAERAGSSHTVTLLTGDKVRVTSLGGRQRGVVVTPGASRSGIAYSHQILAGELTVLPSDAAPLVAAGKLDARLFNVSKLIAYRYDDASAAALPLIVTHPGQPQAKANAAVRAGDGTVVRTLASVSGLAVRQPKAQTTQFWRSVVDARPGIAALSEGIGKIWLDGRVKATLDQSVPQIGAPAAWKAGLTGKGVKVAILDTGYDAKHPDLAKAVIGAEDFSGSASGVADKLGHGTHVAATVASRGGPSGRYTGVAPGASLLVGKVLDDDGFGEDSWIIAGMEWAADQGAKVVNLSLGGEDTPELDPMEEAVNKLSAAKGVLFAIAAGNEGGFGDRTVGSPGSADAALTVAAVTKSDEMADFSSRGPRLGDEAVKPDIAAPGHNIVAARAAGTTLGPAVGKNHTALSGTSMATPHIAGAAAILAQQHPDWTAARLKAALMSTAKPNPTARVWDQGTGRVDVARAVRQPVSATPASLSYGLLPWPHDHQAPVTKNVTIRNDGPAPVSLGVTVTVLDSDGRQAPAGLFTAGARRLTVPAKGTADLPVTLVPAADVPDGLYSGHLTAASADGRTAVQVALGFNKEQRSHDVTVNAIDRDGKPAGAELLNLISYQGLDQIAAGRAFLDTDGSVTLRLHPGRYHIGALIQTGTEASANYTVLGEPDVDVTGDRTLTFDAREGRPVEVTVDRPGMASTFREMGTMLFGKSPFPLASGISDDPRAEQQPAFFAAPTHRSAARPESFAYEFRDVLVPQGSDRNEPSEGPVYNINLYEPGRIPEVLTRRLTDGDFGAVRDRFYRQGKADVVEFDVFGAIPGLNFAFGSFSTVKAPGTFLSFYTPGPVRWSRGIAHPIDEAQPDFASVGTDRVFRAGERATDSWDRAVVGPAFPATTDPFVARRGNTFVANVPLFSDSGTDHFAAQLDDGESATVSLYRGGKLIDSRSFKPDGFGEIPFAEFQLPAGQARYRLVARTTRTLPGITDLSTKVDTAWTFASRHVPGASYAPLPVMALRFTAPVDLNNEAPAGTVVRMPLFVQRQSGSTSCAVRQVTVDVSFDDGKTWKPTRVAGTGTDRTVSVSHPALGLTNGFVSLRASATDAAGNRVEQTTIRAYRLR